MSIVETKQPIKSREISKFCLAIDRRQQGYPKERFKQKIKRVYSGYGDLAIWMKGIPYKIFSSIWINHRFV